jgi:predicted HicB family RNase H-like nuclease
MAIKCKRIINGKTYNTETATEIEGWDIEEDEVPAFHGQHLFQNRFGAFFLHSYFTQYGDDDYEKIEPYSPEQARDWLEKHRSYRADLIEALFGKMPEAGSGESKFTLRMPDSLRDRLAERARANNQSLNAWIVRCLESCAAEPASEAESGDKRDANGQYGSR